MNWQSQCILLYCPNRIKLLAVKETNRNHRTIYINKILKEAANHTIDFNLIAGHLHQTLKSWHDDPSHNQPGDSVSLDQSRSRRRTQCGSSLHRIDCPLSKALSTYRKKYCRTNCQSVVRSGFCEWHSHAHFHIVLLVDSSKSENHVALLNLMHIWKMIKKTILLSIKHGALFFSYLLPEDK